jgi:hypothetical protein
MSDEHELRAVLGLELLYLELPSQGPLIALRRLHYRIAYYASIFFACPACAYMRQCSNPHYTHLYPALPLSRRSQQLLAFSALISS